jgi:hypothetical protein
MEASIQLSRKGAPEVKRCQISALIRARKNEAAVKADANTTYPFDHIQAPRYRGCCWQQLG